MQSLDGSKVLKRYRGDRVLVRQVPGGVVVTSFPCLAIGRPDVSGHVHLLPGDGDQEMTPTPTCLVVADEQGKSLRFVFASLIATSGYSVSFGGEILGAMPGKRPDLVLAGVLSCAGESEDDLALLAGNFTGSGFLDLLRHEFPAGR